MSVKPLSMVALLAQTFAVIRKKAMVLLLWGGVAALLCLPCAVFFLQQLNLSDGGRPDPVLLWGSFTPLAKIGNLFSIWFMSLGLMGLTQAICTLAVWDAGNGTPTTPGNLATRLFPKLHRILGLQLFVVLMIIMLVPLAVFAFPAMLLDNFGVFKALGKSVEFFSRHAGKTVLILLAALVVAVGWMLGVRPIIAPQGHMLLVSALALEMRLALFYWAGAVIAIPTTLIYYHSRAPVPPAP